MRITIVPPLGRNNEILISETTRGGGGGGETVGFISERKDFRFEILYLCTYFKPHARESCNTLGTVLLRGDASCRDIYDGRLENINRGTARRHERFGKAFCTYIEYCFRSGLLRSSNIIIFITLSLCMFAIPLAHLLCPSVS